MTVYAVGKTISLCINNGSALNPVALGSTAMLGQSFTRDSLADAARCKNLVIYFHTFTSYAEESRSGQILTSPRSSKIGLHLRRGRYRRSFDSHAPSSTNRTLPRYCRQARS